MENWPDDSGPSLWEHEHQNPNPPHSRATRPEHGARLAEGRVSSAWPVGVLPGSQVVLTQCARPERAGWGLKVPPT